MSSIDKDVITFAKNIDSRVRVTNSGGRIVGRINGQVVFDIADRYGYMNDNEKSRVRQAMNTFLYEESEEGRRRREEEERRRREEEERRRREEEERRRRLEEQRQQAISQSRAIIEQKRAEVERYFNNLSINQNSTFIVPNELSEMLDISNLVANTKASLEKNQKDAQASIRHSKENLLKLLNSTSLSLGAATNASAATELGNRAKQITFAFDTKSVNDKNSEIVASLNSILNQCTAVLKKVKEANNKYHNETTAALLNRIKNIPITTTKDLQKVTTMLNDAIASIADEKEKAKLQEAINSLNEANEGLMNMHLSSNVDSGSKYEIPTYLEEINMLKSTIISIRENLLNASFTSLSVAQMSEVDNYIANSETGEQMYNLGQQIIDRLQSVALSDERMKPTYNAFLKAKEEAQSLGIEVDMNFDPLEGEGQLDQICDMVAVKQIQEEKKTLWESAMATQALMDGLSWDVLGEKEEEGVVSFIYARKDVPGVVMQVNITSDNIRRKLIGVKVNGKETSIEAVKEAGRKLEALNEPSMFMNGFKTIFPESVLDQDFGLADDPGIDEVIKRNGIYDLDEENKTNEFNEITGENIKEVSTVNAIKYVASTSQSITNTLKNEASLHRQKKAAANKARYQHL